LNPIHLFQLISFFSSLDSSWSPVTVDSTNSLPFPDSPVLLVSPESPPVSPDSPDLKNAQVDSDGSGTIDFDEFREIMN